MKLITPPKLIPPCQSAAAIGTLPIEHTKLMHAMNGPTSAFSRLVQNPWPPRNKAFQTSIGIFDVTLPWLYVSGAEAAWATGQPALADSILTRLELVCRPCDFYYQYEAPIARARGYTAAADSFVARIGRSRAR